MVSFLALPIFWVVVNFQTGQLFPKTPLDLPILLLALWTLFSLIITPDIENSAGKVLGVYLGIFYYYAIIGIGKNTSPNKTNTDFNVLFNSRLFLISLLVTLMGSGVATLGLLGAEWFDKYPVLTEITKAIPTLIPDLPGSGAGFQPNAISGTLTLLTPLSIMTFWIMGKPLSIKVFGKNIHFSELVLRSVLVGLVLVQMGWWILAQTRGAWLGLAAGLIFLWVIELKPRWYPAAIILPLLIVALTYVYWFQREGMETLTGSLRGLHGRNLTDTLQFRFQVWWWALLILVDFPITGLGYNMFRVIAPQIYLGPELGDIAHAHNIWLDVGVSLGIGGVVIYLSIYMINVFVLWNIWDRNKGQWHGKMAISLLSGWYAYFVFGLADTIPLGSKLGLTIFIILAIGQVLNYYDQCAKE